MNLTVPPKERDEWRMLIRGKIEHKFTNYVLQMRIDKAISNVEKMKQTECEAIDEIYSICNKYKNAVQQDLNNIFDEKN